MQPAQPGNGSVKANRIKGRKEESKQEITLLLHCPGCWVLCVCGPHSCPKGCSRTQKGSEKGGEGDQRDGAVSIRKAVIRTKALQSRKGTTDVM